MIRIFRVVIKSNEDALLQLKQVLQDEVKGDYIYWFYITDFDKIEKQIRDSIAEVKHELKKHKEKERWVDAEYSKGIISGLELGLMALGRFEMTPSKREKPFPEWLTKTLEPNEIDKLLGLTLKEYEKDPTDTNKRLLWLDVMLHLPEHIKSAIKHNPTIK